MNNPYLINWAITNKCNFKCLHCKGMTKEELDGKTLPSGRFFQQRIATLVGTPTK